MFIKYTISNFLSIRVLENQKSALLKTFKLPGRSCCRTNGPHLKGFIKGHKNNLFSVFIHSLVQSSQQNTIFYIRVKKSRH